MNANNIKTKRFFAQVFFWSKSGNSCAYQRYIDIKDKWDHSEEIYQKMVNKVKKLKHFDRVYRVDIVEVK